MTAIQWKGSFEFITQPGPRVRATANVLLVLLLAHSLAQLTWRLLPAPEMANVVPLAVTAMPVSSRVGIQSQIPLWHLFGTVNSEAAAPAPVNLPETTLKLILRGVIASPDPDEARAIIVDPGGKENFYRVGDKLPGNAELKEIHGDRVVIQRGARFETLKLPKESLGMQTTETSPTLASPQARNLAGNYTLGQYRDALLNDPKQVADLIRFEPADQAGKFVGYRIQPGRDVKMLSRYGLMPGDVITSVNGVELDSPAKGLGLLKDLSTTSTLDLEIERNGTRQRFVLPIN